MSATTDKFIKVLIARGQVHTLKFYNASGQLSSENLLDGYDILSLSIGSPTYEQIEKSAINDENPDKSFVSGAATPGKITIKSQVTTDTKQISPPSFENDFDISMSPQAQYQVVRANGNLLFQADVNIESPGNIEIAGKGPMDTEIVLQVCGEALFFEQE